VSAQAPIKVNERTKDRVRYLAALTDATQAEIVDRAVSEYATRHADAIARGLDRACASRCVPRTRPGRRGAQETRTARRVLLGNGRASRVSYL